MGYVNEALIVGRLGSDPELDYTKAGMAVCRMSAATHQKYKKGEQTITETEWHRVVLFGRRAEIAAQALKKGDSVYVKGVKRTTVFKGKDNQQKQKVELIALDVKWAGSEKLDFTGPQIGGGQKSELTKSKPMNQLAAEASLDESQIEQELAELRKQSSAPGP